MTFKKLGLNLDFRGGELVEPIPNLSIFIFVNNLEAEYKIWRKKNILNQFDMTLIISSISL